MQIGVESSRSVENKRIFVIDTDEVCRAALQFMLHDENETHELKSIDQAIAKSAEWKPDAILLGTQIVEELGSNVIPQLREAIPGVRVAVVVDSADDPFALICVGAGAHTTIVKPLTIESVRRQVNRMLGRRTAISIPVGVA